VRLLPTRARLAGTGLAIAAITIIALAVAILIELEREVDLHRAVASAQQVKDSLDKLRIHLTELRAAARLSALTGDAEAYHQIETRAGEVETELVYLAQRASADAPLPTFEALAPAARMLVMHARSISNSRGSRGTLGSAALAREAERVESEAIRALERSDAAVTARINSRTEAQLQLGERLRKYVSWMLIGSIAVLAALFAGYRRLQLRDRETQKRIEHLAHFDMVTGLPNRALLSDRLAQETARARRASSPFAVLMFDLDGFKKVNDTWGHAAGDRVLMLVGERVRRCVRASDTVGRLGGDEFLAILPETTLAGALGVAEKLRESLREPYPLDKAVASLSTSVGVSLFPAHGADPESLLRAADAALYRAKREGKDRIVVAPDVPQAAPTDVSTRDAA
jgi:diguanylate cyclase (GGDEF)-like protein